MFDLTGKRALITRASGGIGELPAKVGTGFAVRQRDHKKSNSTSVEVLSHV
jgi:hypothetical protein